jgi:DnaJ-class molecular chaperone
MNDVDSNILEVRPDADSEAIEKACRARAVRYHFDKHFSFTGRRKNSKSFPGPIRS